ncbi:TonB-dependent receptor, partial [Saprospiraceae bacterium]|nr:TonB-dependent receptor [Saprospiraceae bacterium]
TGNGYRDFSDYDAHNGFLSLEYKFNESTDIEFEYTHYNYLARQAGGLTDQQFETDPRQSTRERNWFDVNWNLYSFKLNHKLGTDRILSLNLFALDASRNSVGYRGDPIDLNSNPITSIDEQDTDGNFISPRDLILGDFNNYGAEIKLLNHYNLFSKKTTTLIGSKYYKSNNSSVQGPGSTGTDADFRLFDEAFPDYPNQSNFRFPNLNVSAFTENIIYLNDKLSLVPGARFEYIKTESIGDFNQVVFDNAGNPIANNQLSDNNTLSRKFVLLGLGLSYRKSKQFQLVANLSQNYRSVTFSDIRVVNPTFIVDPDIRDETGFTADIGVKGFVDNVLSYDITAYSVLYDDRIGIILDNRANRVRKNIGQAIIAGTETLINLNLSRWINPGERSYNLNLFANLSYTYSEYIDSEENNVVGKKVEFIPTINLKTGINASYKSVRLSYQFTYLSQQFTDVQNSAPAALGDSRSGIIGTIPSYAISDLSLTLNLGLIEIGSGINNLWDRAYFTRRATGYPGPGIIPSDPRTYYVTVSYKLNR